MRWIAAAALASLSLASAPAAVAQTYPNRPLRLVVPYPPGGGTDTLARPLAERLRQRLGQPVVVENRGGAATNIGMEHVARSAPDGYTVAINADNVALYPHLYSKVPYDLFRDFAHVTFVAGAPMVLGANPRAPLANVGDLVAVARREPERLRFANPSFGSPHHLAFELFAREARIRVNAVDYRGGGPALNDVIAGHVELGVFTLGAGLPHFQAGTVRPLAVMSAGRNELVPDVPSVADAGLPGAQMELRYFLSVPAATPRDVVMTLNAAVRAALADGEFHAQLVRQGFEPGATTPEEAEAGLRREHERWGPILRAANIRLD